MLVNSTPTLGKYDEDTFAVEDTERVKKRQKKFAEVKKLNECSMLTRRMLFGTVQQERREREREDNGEITGGRDHQNFTTKET